MSGDNEMAGKSAQEAIAKALWVDGNNRIGHRPWATVSNAYMAEAGHAIAALVANGFVIADREKVREAVEILDREFGHAEAIHNAAALEALARLREAI